MVSAFRAIVKMKRNNVHRVLKIDVQGSWKYCKFPLGELWWPVVEPSSWYGSTIYCHETQRSIFFPSCSSRLGFPCGSAGKESACNTGDPGSIPGSGRPPGEGVGYPLQYSWAALVAQLVKNLPAMWQTWVRPLGWEDPLKKGKATSSILAWRIPWTIQSTGSQRVGHDKGLSLWI